MHLTALVDVAGDFEKDEIVKFINGNNLPLVMPFNQKNQPKIFGGDIKTHMLLFAAKDKIEVCGVPVQRCAEASGIAAR
jgi:hypothetical protein